jgi:tRNA pseudouridine55 synthase
MGVFIVNKPLGMTSFDVVAKARKLLGTKRIGHTGTLDPLATGVLVLLTDESTKLVPYLEIVDKDYLAFVSLGVATKTLDAEGPITEKRIIPTPSETTIKRTLRRLTGVQEQIPPMHSAIHVNGQRAYALARAGQAVELKPRTVVVHHLKLLHIIKSMRDATAFSKNAFPKRLADLPTLVLDCSVSSGTYIRSLARDIGESLATKGHLAGLVRTRVGKFRLEDAVELDALTPEKALPDLVALEYPVIQLDAKQARDTRDGKRIATLHQGRATLMFENLIVAIAEGDGSSFKVLRAWQ